MADLLEALTLTSADELAQWAWERGVIDDPQVQALLLMLLTNQDPFAPVLPSSPTPGPSSSNPTPMLMPEPVISTPKIDDDEPEPMSEPMMTPSSIEPMDVDCSLPSPNQPERRRSKYYICNICSKKFLTKKKLEQHTNQCKEAHENNPPVNLNTGDNEIDSASREVYSCNTCGNSFNKSSFFKHVKSCHSPVLKTETGFKCIKCNKSYARKQNWEKHSCKEIKCSRCGKGFSTKRELERKHARVCPGTPTQFPCKYCNRNFGYLKNLENHTCLYCFKCGKVCKKVADFRKHGKTCTLFKYTFTCKVTYILLNIYLLTWFSFIQQILT